MEQVQSLLDEYWEWLRNKTVLRQVEGWTEITTPYLDRHNDHLQLYVQAQNGIFNLTDDGYIIQDLEMSGCDLSGKKRQDLLRQVLNGFGVQQEGDALIVQATPQNFASRQHSLIQAMLAINDIFYTAQTSSQNFFVEDVAGWLDLEEIRYVRTVKLTGQSGFDHVFDFAIPKSRAAPERIVQAINHPDRNSAQRLITAWFDTHEMREEDSRAYAFLNDSDRPPSNEVTEALNRYLITPVLWTQRQRVRNELAA